MARRIRRTWLVAAVLVTAVAVPGGYAANRPSPRQRAETERALGSTVNPAAVGTSRRTRAWAQIARAQTERALGSTVDPSKVIARSHGSVARLREQTERALGSTVGIGLKPLALAPVAVASRGGFDWGDASVGGGLVAALGLLAAGALLLIRRRGASTA
jgi:hypothetical protein